MTVVCLRNMATSVERLNAIPGAIFAFCPSVVPLARRVHAACGMRIYRVSGLFRRRAVPARLALLDVIGRSRYHSGLKARRRRLQ
jgi:hypothetical protein